MKLTVENVSYTYDGSYYLWEHVSFAVNPGEIFSLLGSNGCGKSTLLRCLIGVLAPKTGRIYIEDAGRILDARKDAEEYTRKIGYVPQMQNTAYSFTVRDYIVMGRAPHLGMFRKPSANDYALCDEVMNEMGIYDIRNHSFNTLSGGQQRQAVIARAIIQQPEMIIMDEPTNHLDYGNQYRVVKMIEKLSEKGIAVILTTHMPDHAIYLGSKVGVFCDHRLVVGKADDVITEEVLEKIYHVKVHLVYEPLVGRNICIAE
ncbi:ABC transporter ATP-binding protein [Dialister sp.]|uniref:ABC transporter ATP-binding protein n=1 Tax=Dialister sp. TaxID=1955814 RepID=UPI003EFF4A15